jgi:hypothetical protein
MRPGRNPAFRLGALSPALDWRRGFARIGALDRSDADCLVGLRVLAHPWPLFRYGRPAATPARLHLSFRAPST